jgi:3-methylfumaryl-CoA hydratase
MQQDIPPSQTLTDAMDPARAAALAATLGLDRAPDAPLIPFGHQVHFWQALPSEALGRDGHPARGGFLPDLGLPRRMWAGGRLAFHQPLMPGVPARKTSTIEAVTRKQGRSGPLGFVTLRHDIEQAGTLAVTEWQDIVYREDATPDSAAPTPPRAPTDAQFSEDHSFSTTLLFRYSALTFNGHRIHYDLDYCREVEGYPGLVVHGPLLAQLLMLMAERTGTPLRRFSFRATAPLFHFETATLCRKGSRLWVCGPDGRLCMEADAG